MCARRFSEVKKGLIYHVGTVHEGRCAYCDVCRKGYRSIEDLSRHIKTIHQF